jgi:hypothetical protein
MPPRIGWRFRRPDADQDSGQAEEDHGEGGWWQGERAAEAVAAIKGTGRRGRGRPPAARRGGEQGWDYIKSNNLQNPENRREILADDKLRKVFGKDKVTMFEMNKHLAQHLK